MLVRLLTYVMLTALLSWPIAAGTETAAEPVAMPEPLTKSDVRNIISRLSDEEVRALFIQQLAKVAVTEMEADTSINFVDGFEDKLDALWQN